MAGDLVTAWLRDLFGVQVITKGGIAVPSRSILELPDGTLTDDPVGKRTIYTPYGVALSPTFGDVTAVSLTIGGYSEKAQAPVATTSNSTANLLATAVPIPAGKGVRIRATLAANIVTATLFYRMAFVLVADYGRSTGGAAALLGAASVEANQPAYPWSVRAATTTITGAADDGGGQVKITVVSSSDLADGNTITIAGAVTSGGLVLNGQWIVDMVPNPTHVVLRGSTFTGAWTSGGVVTPNGAIGLSLSSNAVQVQATGIKAAAWLASEGVHGGELRSNVHGTYVYTDPGTTAAMGAGPTGTTTGTDGTAPYAYIGAGTSVPITWTTFLETWT